MSRWNTKFFNFTRIFKKIKTGTTEGEVKKLIDEKINPINEEINNNSNSIINNSNSINSLSSRVGVLENRPSDGNNWMEMRGGWVESGDFVFSTSIPTDNKIYEFIIVFPYDTGNGTIAQLNSSIYIYNNGYSGGILPLVVASGVFTWSLLITITNGKIVMTRTDSNSFPTNFQPTKAIYREVTNASL